MTDDDLGRLDAQGVSDGVEGIKNPNTREPPTRVLNGERLGFMGS